MARTPRSTPPDPRQLDLFTVEQPAPAAAAPPPGADASPVRRRAAAVSPRGRVHDLAVLAERINRRYFAGGVTVPITWGRWPAPAGRRRRRQTLHLGTFSAAGPLVRVHPVLAHESVPEVVVASVVHHELLHAALGEERRGGRRYLHTPEFRRREREFEGHAEAARWIRLHLPVLLARRARGPADAARSGRRRGPRAGRA